MEMILVFDKKEENGILNVVSATIEKRICVNESKGYEGKWGVIQITPTETALIVNAQIEPNCVVDVIDMTTSLFKDVKDWAMKYAEGLMEFTDRWADKLMRDEDDDTEEME